MQVQPNTAMHIRVGYDIAFDFPARTEMVFSLYLHPSRYASVISPERFSLTPNVPVSTYTDAFGNVCGRAEVPAGTARFWNEAVVEDSGRPDPIDAGAKQWKIVDLPPDTLQFLLPSRYCEVDSELSHVAWNLIQFKNSGWEKVQAICDFVHSHIRFDYQQARPTRTALDAYREKLGVCRDFMHLAVTLCRCVNIPARDATGYLGDICVPPAPFPMDFSAWFEVFLGDRWHTFDARHNERRVGRVLMATGRDAADVALTTYFGPSIMRQFTVWTDEVGAAQSQTY
jgi:transglutaminase-like putative cysteine protease